MKKLEVHKDMCISCGACVSIDPEHFEFDDDGLSTAISQENLDSALVLQAVESCPTNAIFLSEEEKEFCSCDQDTCNCAEDECSKECKCAHAEKDDGQISTTDKKESNEE